MKKNNVVEKTITYIEAHLEEELSLEIIAKELNYSKFYIARTFAEQTNCTVYKYIQGRRMTIAAKQLVETEKPMIEIAYEAHYNSQQAFTMAFHRVYQCTPQSYRKKGIFYPVQTTLYKESRVLWLLSVNSRMGGRMAA